MVSTAFPCLIAALLVVGCTPIASVSERRPQFRQLGELQGTAAAVGEKVANALRGERRQPLVALGEYLEAARLASDGLARNPDDSQLRDTYNFAVARAVTAIQDAGISPWKAPVRVPSPSGEFVLSWERDPRPAWNPALYRFVPADQFDVRGAYVRERSIKEGIGAPLVAIGRDRNEHYRERFGLPRTYYGVTSLIQFQGRTAKIAFRDPLETEEIRLAGHTFPLAADFTVPIAVLLQSAKPQTLGIPRLLFPERYAETARISRLEPYDPKKTVVLVIHGLMDSPATWTPMINHLRANKEIRKNYQFWFYSYPSGYPYPYAAALLRRELDAVAKKFTIQKPMVLIGHSMGGCIARLLITDTDDTLWTEVFRKTPAETRLTEGDRELLSEMLVFRSRPEIGRVIFISAPLQGSNIARNPLGRIGSMLVKAPSHLRETGRNVLSLASLGTDDLRLRRFPNSIDTLAPNSRFVRAINTIPMNQDVTLNVISGDRGRGGNKDRTKPQMSDGVVPYWSSHIEGAASELVVPSDHGAHQNQQAIEEVRRILIDAD